MGCVRVSYDGGTPIKRDGVAAARKINIPAGQAIARRADLSADRHDWPTGGAEAVSCYAGRVSAALWNLQSHYI
jgi:hypothetical protein